MINVINDQFDSIIKKILKNMLENVFLKYFGDIFDNEFNANAFMI